MKNSKYKYIAKTIIFCMGIACCKEAFAWPISAEEESNVIGPNHLKAWTPKNEWETAPPQGKVHPTATDVKVLPSTSSHQIWGPYNFSGASEQESIFEKEADSLRYRWP